MTESVNPHNHAAQKKRQESAEQFAPEDMPGTATYRSVPSEVPTLENRDSRMKSEATGLTSWTVTAALLETVRDEQSSKLVQRPAGSPWTGRKVVVKRNLSIPASTYLQSETWVIPEGSNEVLAEVPLPNWKNASEVNAYKTALQTRAREAQAATHCTLSVNLQNDTTSSRISQPMPEVADKSRVNIVQLSAGAQYSLNAFELSIGNPRSLPLAVDLERIKNPTTEDAHLAAKMGELRTDQYDNHSAFMQVMSFFAWDQGLEAELPSVVGYEEYTRSLRGMRSWDKRPRISFGGGESPFYSVSCIRTRPSNQTNPYSSVRRCEVVPVQPTAAEIAAGGVVPLSRPGNCQTIAVERSTIEDLKIPEFIRALQIIGFDIERSTDGDALNRPEGNTKTWAEISAESARLRNQRGY